MSRTAYTITTPQGDKIKCSADKHYIVVYISKSGYDHVAKEWLEDGRVIRTPKVALRTNDLTRAYNELNKLGGLEAHIYNRFTKSFIDIDQAASRALQAAGIR